VSQEFLEVGVRCSTIFPAQAIDILRVASKNSGNLNVRNSSDRTRVRLTDISAANQSYMRGHLLARAEEAIP
jgi:hypothetical protein